MAQQPGIDKLKRRLVDEIPKKVRAALEIAMLESADLVITGAKLRVPVDTGEVRDSIRHHGVKEGKFGGLRISVTAGDSRTTEPGGGKTFQIARLLEFGTEKMAAQPFLLPTYRMNKRRITARLRKAMRDAIMQG